MHEAARAARYRGARPLAHELPEVPERPGRRWWKMYGMLRLDALEIEGAERGAECGLVGPVQNLVTERPGW